jgi:hypothetical protein
MEQGHSDRPEFAVESPGIWAIRICLQLAGRLRDLALFDLAIDSTLRGCDLVALRARDVAHRAIVLQHKTQQSVSSS